MSTPSYDTIKHLGGLSHIRQRPGMYVGSFVDNLYNSACMNCFREVIGNNVDEFMNGHATDIWVTVTTATNTVSIRDNGRGIPFGPTVYVDPVSKAEYEVDKFFMATGIPNTGAKYDKGDAGSFKFAIGMNGIGIKAVNALSDMFYGCSVRDGQIADVVYHKGEISAEGVQVQTANTSLERGTTITWQLDKSILPFDYDLDHIARYLQEVAYLNAGIRIHLNVDDKPEVTYFEPQGLTSFASKLVGTNKVMVDFPVLTGEMDTGSKFEIILKSLESNAEIIHAYVNGSTIETASAPVAAARQAYGRAVLQLWKNHPKLKKHEKLELQTQDIRSGLLAIVKILHVDPAFDSQTKTKLVNTDIASAIQTQLPPLIQAHLLANPNQLVAVFNQAVMQAEAREAADRARDAVRKNAAERGQSFSVSLDTYTPPLKVDPDKNRLYLMEGDSAAGSLIKAIKTRDPETGKLYKDHIGALALRGNVLNALEKSLADALKNKELNTLVEVAGLNRNDPSDLSGLKYRDFIIATDADAGGAHIATLLVGFFLVHFPELIRQGRLHRVITPLFEVQDKKTKQLHFIYPDEDREAGVRRIGFDPSEINTKYTIKRDKGLGEMSDLANLTLVAKPRLQTFQTEDIEGMIKLYSVFSGSAFVPMRRELIFTLGVTKPDAEAIA